MIQNFDSIIFLVHSRYDPTIIQTLYCAVYHQYEVCLMLIFSMPHLIAGGGKQSK